MATKRISSLDSDYVAGGLSVYPVAIDSVNTLYETRNNAQTLLKQTLPYTGKSIIVEDTSSFPSRGLLRIGPPPGQSGNAELIYYGKKTINTFQELIRGFAGSKQSVWPVGAFAANSVMAEHHNALKDAILNIQKKIGTRDFPEDGSLNAIVKELENRFLAPKPIFRATPLRGRPPLEVRFQNLSGGNALRFLWDFGDGGTSTETNPIHTYRQEGIYSVKLNMISTLGGQGISTKRNYIVVSEQEGPGFFYVDKLAGNSVQTSGSSATSFKFIDQTDGPIIERIWNFGDGSKATLSDPDIHTTDHVYQKPGRYKPSLLVMFEDQKLKSVSTDEIVEVL